MERKFKDLPKVLLETVDDFSEEPNLSLVSKQMAALNSEKKYWFNKLRKETGMKMVFSRNKSLQMQYYEYLRKLALISIRNMDEIKKIVKEESFRDLLEYRKTLPNTFIFDTAIGEFAPLSIVDAHLRRLHLTQNVDAENFQRYQDLWNTILGVTKRPWDEIFLLLVHPEYLDVLDYLIDNDTELEEILREVRDRIMSNLGYNELDPDYE